MKTEQRYIKISKTENQEDMSISLTANKSFLHNGKKSIKKSDKTIYTSIDRLALKRATLPLQLLPIDDNPTVENEKAEQSSKSNPVINDFVSRVKLSSEVPINQSESKNEIDSETKENKQKVVSKPEYSKNQENVVYTKILNKNIVESSVDDNSDYEEIETVFQSSGEAYCVQNTTSKLDRPTTLDLDFDHIKAQNNLMNDSNAETKQKETQLCDSSSIEKVKGNHISTNLSVERGSVLCSVVENEVVRKKKYFAKSMFHYVPSQMGKRSKKFRRKGKLSTSLTSLKSEHSDVKLNTSKPRSHSREDLKYVTISLPTNFVHVASATNLALNFNRNYDNSDFEQVVITHEQKCATLPLLIGNNETSKTVEQSFGRCFKKKIGKSTTKKSEKTAYVEIVNDAKEPMKSSNKTNKNLNSTEISDTDKNKEICTEKQSLYEPMSNFASFSTNVPQANASFLWSNKRSKNTSQSVDKEEENKSDDEMYDAIEPKDDFQEDNDYDDIGLPDDEIYDDVGEVSLTRKKDNYIEVNGIELRRKTLREKFNDTKEEERFDNDYSSVEEIDSVDEQVIYDDVILPSEQERVNSLYASSASGTSARPPLLTNSKESEWEDLEDSPVPNRKNDSCKNIENGKKKRRTRKAKRQRSKGHRKNVRSGVLILPNSENDDTVSEDSNYETLGSISPEDVSTNSEIYANEAICTLHAEEKLSDVTTNGNELEAPTKPTPPPPREASLSQTFGKRMKMFKRTWSITKGSLGRIRRRASVDEDNFTETKDSEHHLADGRKYFSFKKHFRRNIASLSTFYLDDSKTNNVEKCTKETIYPNNNWYTEGNIDQTSTTSSETNGITDHYSTLTEEPLYQFYAAAAARDAFEFESDGYEEVEKINSNVPTTDFGKPGHRTLWCQTPQVISSNLLQKLTVEDRKIQEAKFEIITSEASYLNSLRVLQNEFLQNSELVNEILTSVERDKLFGEVPSILAESERFLLELENVWRSDPLLSGLPDVLLKYADRCLNIYVNYCSNQVSIDSTLKDLRARKGQRFLEAVSRIEMHPACQSLSLHSFLMLPMQRITRLPLLADAVLSKLSMEHTDRPVWEKILQSFSFVVAECNEGARIAAQATEMEMLARKLEYSAKIKPIVLRDRYLVRSGALTQLTARSDTEYKLTFGKKFHKIHLHLFLLTDYLLIAKPKHNTQEDTYTVIDTCKRSLIALEPVSDESPFAGRNALILTLLENHCGRQSEYVLACNSNTEKERWLEAVLPPNPSLVGETLYETWDCPQVMALYSYSPAQPDELMLQPGDIINVLRKMADGWYHGEKLLHGEQGWFPGNYTKEVASEHVRARNLKQRHRFLAISGNLIQRRMKQNIATR